jgi:hypothetical protein
VYEKQLTIHVAEAGVKYRKRLTRRKQSRLETAMQTFVVPHAPPLVPLLAFIGPPPEEPEAIYEEPPPKPEREAEPEPFKYTRKPTVTDADYEIITASPTNQLPGPSDKLPPPVRSGNSDPEPDEGSEPEKPPYGNYW